MWQNLVLLKDDEQTGKTRPMTSSERCASATLAQNAWKHDNIMNINPDMQHLISSLTTKGVFCVAKLQDDYCIPRAVFINDLMIEVDGGDCAQTTNGPIGVPGTTVAKILACHYGHPEWWNDMPTCICRPAEYIADKFAAALEELETSDVFYSEAELEKDCHPRKRFKGTNKLQTVACMA